MEPIISPWLIYAVSTLDNMKGLMVSVIMIDVVASILFTVAWIESYGEDAQKYSRRAKWAWASIFFLALLAVLIPGKDVMYAMLAAQYITPDNVQAVQGNIADFVSEIIKAATTPSNH